MPRKKSPHLSLVDPDTLPKLVIHSENPNVTARVLANLIAHEDNIFRYRDDNPHGSTSARTEPPSWYSSTHWA